MGSPDFFLHTKHLSVSLEIPLKDFRGQGFRGFVPNKRGHRSVNRVRLLLWATMAARTITLFTLH